MRRLERADLGALLEEAGQTVEGERLPLAELGGTDAVLGGESGDRFLLLKEFVDDLRLEGRRKLFPHACNLSRKAASPQCPNSWIHCIDSSHDSRLRRQELRRVH